MKSLKYTLIISLLAILFPVTSMQACWHPYYLSKAYYMYRVLDADAPDAYTSSSNTYTDENCREWQRYSSKGIPLSAIHDVVYTMPLYEYESFHSIHKNYRGKNAFLQWLRNNSEAADFLLIAKITENVRREHNSRWYYPSTRSEAKMTLEEVVDYTLSYSGPLRYRYLLQAVRALFTLKRYSECISLWNKEISQLPKGNLMRRMALPYIAGAAYWLKDYDKATAYFHEAGDVASMIAYSGDRKTSSTVDIIENIYKYEPNCAAFPELLQKFVNSAEPIGYVFEDEEQTVTDEHRRLKTLAGRIAQEGKTDNPAMWYYTAAFIEDLEGHAAGASRLLAKAEKARGTQFIKESVKVMRIYLDAKLQTYNLAYENRLLNQLQWLDQKIIDNLTPKVRQQTTDGYYFEYNTSYYYWNDMLRRIVLAEVCPRMLTARKPIRALQLANMADNRLLQYLNVHSVCDYSNSFFELIDSIGLHHAMEYRQRILKPRNSFERFLNERGYVDMDYINDIVGTQCLRNMHYGDAMIYLRQVSPVFQKTCLHTWLEYAPFSYNRKEVKDVSDFKYRFAREMHSLEQEILLTSEPNRKAELMVSYAVGLQNSFDRCWSLTQYYRGTRFYVQIQEKRDWENEPETIKAKKRSSELLQQAFALFTDRELAAKTLYEFNKFRTVAEKYPETKLGRYVRGHCDNLHDYALQ